MTEATADEKKPDRREERKKETYTAFDRDLIKAAKDPDDWVVSVNTDCPLEILGGDRAFSGSVLQVDKFAVKFKAIQKEFWISKSHIAMCLIEPVNS